MKLQSIFVATLLCATLHINAQTLKHLTVGPITASPKPDFPTLTEAIAAAPDTGAEITILPGRYVEVVHIDKPNIHLRGQAPDASKTVIAFANGASNTCGTFCSATIFVTGDGFLATGITIANEWSLNGKPRTQGVALSISADRAVLRNVRLLGAQDTLLADAKPCKDAPCKPTRQFYDHCYIEGEVDFIFGAAKAVFQDCEIHSITHAAGGYLTAQGRTSATQDAGYVFDHCRLTADPGVKNVFLGRPWKDFATVAFLNTEMAAHIAPEGWREWHPGETEKLKTSSYAEYASTGPGATGDREPLAKRLTVEEAKSYRAPIYLAGSDHWDPRAIK